MMDGAVETKKKRRAIKPKRVAFDNAVDRGLNFEAALKEAEYAPRGGWASKLANDPEIKKRIADVALDRKWGGSPDLAPVINRMRDIALDTEIAKSAATMKEAREILLAIAQLKALLPKTALAIAKAPGLPDDEWLAKYGPRA